MFSSSNTNHPTWRKVLYGIVGVALVALAAFGIVSVADAQALQESLGTVVASFVALVGAASNFLAMVKTHFGSDDPTTAKDVEDARREGREEEADRTGGSNLTAPRPGANLPAYQRPGV